MSTDTTTETATRAAQRLDGLIPAMIRERRMRDLWGDGLDRDRHISMALLAEMGRDKPGDGWQTAAGSIKIMVHKGAADWQRAYEELRAVVERALPVLYQLQVDDAITLVNLVTEPIDEALRAPMPHKPDSAPYLYLREARELPDAITRARNEGALEALNNLIPLLPTELFPAVSDVADEYGGFGEYDGGAKSEDE